MFFNGKLDVDTVGRTNGEIDYNLLLLNAITKTDSGDYLEREQLCLDGLRIFAAFKPLTCFIMKLVC